MGCDGGTIPRRDELVRLKKKPEQKDKDAERQFRWLHCALTQQRLQQPIVMCGLGRLYSKQNIIEQLLEKDKMPESCSHIRSLKDVKNLNLTPNPAFKDDEKSEGILDTRSAPFICKLIGLEMSGKFRFVALWTCGCVFSERALKEVKSNVCALCQTPFQEQDVVILNGTDEEVDLMRVKMEARVARRKAAKKEKSSTKNKSNSTEPSTSKATIDDTIKVDTNTTALGKPPKSKVVLPAKRVGTLEDPAIKKLKTEYSVAKDPKATDVYKSLFTTHKSEQEQSRAHWVTYNPFYN